MRCKNDVISRLALTISFFFGRFYMENIKFLRSIYPRRVLETFKQTSRSAKSGFTTLSQ